MSKALGEIGVLEGLTLDLVTSINPANPVMCQPDNSDGCDPDGTWCVPQVGRTAPTTGSVTTRDRPIRQPAMCNPTASCGPDEDCSPDDECGPACGPWPS